MKFFKYLIAPLFLFISTFANAVDTWTASGSGKTFSASTADGACLGLYQLIYPNGNAWKNNGPNSTNTLCTLTNGYSGSSLGDLKKDSNNCASTASTPPITAVGWQNMTLDQTDAYIASLPKTVCHQGCTYSSPSLLNSSSDPNQLSTTYGNPVQNSCSGSLPSTPMPSGLSSGGTNGTGGTGGTNGNCTTTGNTTNCTGGQGGQGGSGTGTGGQGGQGGQGGNASITVDMQSVVNAVNNSASTLSQKLDEVKASITGSISNMTNRITDAIGVTNTKLDEVKAEQKNTTTAVNTNTDAVNASRQAIVSAVNNLHATINTVTTAVDKNTTAVNANGDKVASSVNQNTNAVNAVKDAVNNLNNAVKAVTDSVNDNGNKTKEAIDSNTNAVNANGDKVANAVNASGKNTVDAVNAGTDATKANGEKLDGVKDAAEEGNGILKEIKDLLKDIKDWLFADVPEDPKTEIPTTQLTEKSFLTNLITVNASYCPNNKVINWSTPVGTLNKTVSFQDFCDATSWFGYLVLAASYYLGAIIVVRDS